MSQIDNGNYSDVAEEIVCRIGDYSLAAAIAVSHDLTRDTLTVWIIPDKDKIHEAPSPHFITSGGSSRNTLQALSGLYKLVGRLGDIHSNSVTIFGETDTGQIDMNHRLKLYSASGDIVVTTSDKDGEICDKRVLFTTASPYFEAVLDLFDAIRKDNGFGPKKDPRNGVLLV